ncbi:hypothetical protein BURKHO8Y_120028 [Burkholderia sp. 8Y]|nr:hypothetical protein BURKHO8Y_120028 [Burkholderia sp. 8Y]
MKVRSTARSPVRSPVLNAIVQCARLITLLQLPGMQVMHALVGCQNRCTNNLMRRFHSLDMMDALATAHANVDAIARRRHARLRHEGRIYRVLPRSIRRAISHVTTTRSRAQSRQ